MILQQRKYIEIDWEWLTLKPSKKMYQNCKDTFSKEYQILNGLCTVTKEAGYPNKTTGINENKDIANITEVVTNFANNTTANRGTFNTMMERKAYIQQ